MLKIINNFLKIDTNNKLYSVATAFYTLFFLPIILNAYFYCDDKLLSKHITYVTSNYDKNIFELSYYDSFLQFYKAGRFYGLYLNHYLIFYLFHERVNYYIVKTIFNLIAVISCAWLLKLLTKNSENFKAFIFLMPLMFLIIITVEPLSSMGLSTQFSAIFIALASGFYILKCETNRKKYAILAYFFFVMAFFYYEIGICIVPIFIILAVRFRLKKQGDPLNYSSNFKALINYILIAIKVCCNELKFHLLTFGAWSLFCLYLRHNSIQVYDGITFGFDLQKFLLTWLRQILVSFPLGGFAKELYWYRPENYQIFLALILAIFSYFIFIRILPKINVKNNYRDTVLIGFSLLLVPPFIISLSFKYQYWILTIAYPNAFIQLFLQFLGVGFLLISYLSYVLENSCKHNNVKRRQITIKFLAVTFAIAVGFINIFYYYFIYYKNIIEYQNDYNILIKAVKKGIFQEISQGHLLLAEFDKTSKHLYFNELFEKALSGDSYKIKDDFRQLNKIIIGLNGYYWSSSIFYYYPMKAIFARLTLDKEFMNIVNKIPKLEKFYYVDNGYSNYDIYNDKYSKQNLEGYVVAGKVDNISYQCHKTNLEQQDCDLNFKILAPKIFIDKDYLFNLENIVSKLKNRFGEDVFVDSIAKIKEDIKNSQDGILIKLENRIYNLKYFR